MGTQIREVKRRSLTSGVLPDSKWSVRCLFRNRCVGSAFFFCDSDRGSRLASASRPYGVVLSVVYDRITSTSIYGLVRPVPHPRGPMALQVLPFIVDVT